MHLAVHVSPVRNSVSPQSLTTELSEFGTQEHTSATHVEFSGPKIVHRVAVPRHTTDRAELAYQLAGAIPLVPSTVSGVTHTPSLRTRALAPRALLKELVVAHWSLPCDKEVARLRRNWNDFCFLPIDSLHFGPATIIIFSNGPVAHISHMEVSA